VTLSLRLIQLRWSAVRLHGYAARLADSFAPKAGIRLFFRNQITKAFKLPFVAELAMGQSLVDRIELPEYRVAVGI
jgi:hypothetical protein